MNQRIFFEKAVIELKRVNPDLYQSIIKSIGYREPLLTDGKQIPVLCTNFTEHTGISLDALVRIKFNRTINYYRRILVAILTEIYAPEILLIPHNKRAPIPRSLVRPICKMVGVDSKQFSRFLKDVRFYYQTYADFRKTTTELTPIALSGKTI